MRLPVTYKADIRSPLPAGEEAQLLEARRRAGTLMGGETAGAQGEVRVWAPQRQRPRQLIGPALAVLVYAIFLGAILYLPRLHLPFSTFMLVISTLLGAGMLASIGIGAATKYSIDRRLSRLRPSYLSTDDAGIAFVTGAQSLALPWEEIIGLRRLGSNALYLYTRSSGPLSISLAGFSRSDVKSLVSLIHMNADLINVIGAAPDPQLSLIRSVHSTVRKPSSWGFEADMAFIGVAMRLVAPSGPLHARSGETLESLTAARDAMALADHADAMSDEQVGEPGPDDTGLR